MAIVGNISIVMFHLGPDHPAYGQLRDCEELIHNTALLTRLLVDVFHRPHRRQVTLYPIDLSDREIGKRIFSNGIKKRGPESGSATEIHVQKVLQIIAGNMARRLKRILQFLHHQTSRVFVAKGLQVRCCDHHRQIAIHLKRGITIADALQAYATSAGIDRQPIDLNTVIKEAVAIYQSCFSSLGVTIKDPSTPVRFKGNPQLLRKMLLEILANADDARPQGGEVSITLQRKKTGLNEACCINSVTRMKVQLMVEDNGPGLPDTLGVHAFDPFTKEARGRKRRGLGLASVSGIVKAHRGQIRFFNRQRGGFVMIIELPL
ncbi:MAG: hypothetical protein JJV98_00595 [Desulfosarcina sp.]|nr:hypothetical protein [Desulfobacterales bacterium]